MSEVLTLKEASEMVRVHRETLRRNAAAGRIPGGRKLGNLWRFDKKVLCDFIANGGDRPPKK